MFPSFFNRKRKLVVAERSHLPVPGFAEQKYSGADHIGTHYVLSNILPLLFESLFNNSALKYSIVTYNDTIQLSQISSLKDEF